MLCKSCVTRSTQPKATPKGVTTRGKTSGSLREMGTQGQRLHQPISLFKQLKEQQLTYLSQKGPGCSCGLTFHRLKRSIHQFLPQKPALEQEKLLAQGCPIVHIPTQKSHFPRELETRKKKFFFAFSKPLLFVHFAMLLGSLCRSQKASPSSSLHVINATH